MLEAKLENAGKPRPARVKLLRAPYYCSRSVTDCEAILKQRPLDVAPRRPDHRPHGPLDVTVSQQALFLRLPRPSQALLARTTRSTSQSRTWRRNNTLSTDLR